ncbi:MAG: hypothetical protein A3B17_02170 [Candidatus Yanofskybacteria bacterium RIFCSPLOWO2_01_FULL_45_72]|nr:MAG: hypothetical protein A3B17_02170 [Candidatus Yanofskybacteria bacterium RIFCSPLOWO2_01_FULL_45_72]
MFPITLDVLIVGGGIAGLWLLDECRRSGYDVLLLESKALGSGQTIASQGILHGGLKYSLARASNGFINNIKKMPPIWQACLSGLREPNISSVRLRGKYCCMWTANSFLSRISQIGVQIGFSSVTAFMAKDERPIPLRDCPGKILRVDEQIIDPKSLLAVLAKRNLKTIIHAPSFNFSSELVTIYHPENGDRVLFKPKIIIFAAGKSNSLLRKIHGLDSSIMVCKPLPILVVSGNLPELNGYCIDFVKARAIITTQRTNANHAVWQVASETAMQKSEGNFINYAWQELRSALPGFKWPDITLSTYTSNRAEIMTGGVRVNNSYALRDGNIITAWPTKLVLAPYLAEQVLKMLPAPSNNKNGVIVCKDWPRPKIAPFPWL